MPNTVKFHRVLRAPPERVYRAFLDPDAMVKWLPPHGFTGKVHIIPELEFSTLFIVPINKSEDRQ